jgi:aerobic-type carbon monoxide dehydrogenase small subunit (CoxS/CutS family)
MPAITLTVNGARREVQVASDVPLLYVLRNDLELRGPQFGCGLSQCGSCSVLIDGKEARSCVLPITRAAGKEITTLEGLRHAGRGSGGSLPPRPARPCIRCSRPGSTSRCRCAGSARTG